MLKIGIPTLVQNVATSVSFLFLTALVNVFGVTASAAVGAVGKINGFAILPAIAMSMSVSAMSAQNIGAGEDARAVKTMKTGMVLAAFISFAIFILVRLFPEAFLSIFGDDAEMMAKGKEYLNSFSFDYLTVPFLFCLNGLFTGAGHTTFSLINSMISSLLVRIPTSYIFGIALNLGLVGVGLGGPFASFVALCIAIWFYFSNRWKKRVIIHNFISE